MTKNKQTNRWQLPSSMSLTREEFMALVSVFGPLCKIYFQHHDLEGTQLKLPKHREDVGCSLAGSLTKLRFTLMYLKENLGQHDHGQLFNMQQARVSKWIKVLLALLEEALARLKKLPQRFSYQRYAFLQTFSRYVLLMDVTEPGIPRSVDFERQKHQYSGKKKTHTVKNNLMVDQKSSILFLSSTYAGSIHDKKIAHEAAHQFPDNMVLIENLGYLADEPETSVSCWLRKNLKMGN